MYSHLKGKSHLMMLQRIRDNSLRVSTGYGLMARNQIDPDEVEYDGNYWEREQGPKKLRPDQERFLDAKGLDRIPAKFQDKNYDHGQFSFREKEFHCDICDVWVRSRDQMQAHKEGKNHKKKSGKVKRFNCKICLIDVTCQDTLDNHMKGKDHIKRAQQMNERRRRMGIEVEEHDGFKTGPLEMAKLDPNEREELDSLRKQVRTLQEKVKSLQEAR